jgi:NADH oxidase (H2O2-forming)
MRFVILGNGIAGISAAYTIRKLNRESNVSIVSEEPHPAYSACLLSDYISGELKRDRVFIKKPSEYLQQDIHLISLQKAISLDTAGREVILGDGSIPYDKLIIATGSKPIIPPIKGIDKKGVFTFKSLEDADRIYRWKGQTAVVIGSGPIGVEASLSLKRKGYRVFLAELLGRILPQVFDDYPAAIIEDILEENGIEVSTHEKVVEIFGRENVNGVVTDRRRIKCDTVIIATGMRPDVGLAEGALELGKLGGILVDDSMCTSVQGIYACGDCVEAKDLVTGHPILSLLWHNARQQGEVVGYNASGVNRTYYGSLNITGVDLHSIHAVSIGRIENSIQEGMESIERERDRRYQRLVLSNGMLVGVQSINWSENLGLLISAILRREKVKSIGGLTSWRQPLFTSRRCIPFGRKLTFGRKQA